MANVKSTVNGRTYIEIKGLIAVGELLPGTPLVLRPLARRLGVSIMPVVEAIRRLERDGLVTVIPKRGAFVKRWSREEILESYHIRRALKSEAARLFVMNATLADKQRLVRLGESSARRPRYSLQAAL